MSTTLHLARRSTPAVLLAGLCLATPAFATNRLPPITVHAAVSKTVVGHSTIGASIEESTFTRRVSYADLDLTTYAGVMKLRNRVQEAAREACTKLDDFYPLERPRAVSCTSNAVAAASPQVDRAIASAQRVATAR